MKTSSFIATLSFAAALLAAPAAQANTDHDVARIGDGNHAAVNSFNNCVRTKWNAGSDPCAPPAPPPPVAAPAEPRFVIAKADRTVYFEFNKHDLTTEAQQKLDSLASKLQSDTQIKQAHVVGYADRIGSDDANQTLSEKRAQAVTQYIISRGFARMGNTETRWLGETVPATQCSDKLKRKELIECLAQDRRVEVEIEYLTRVPAGQ
jgi:OmpA-OmpF porin, OOP family